VDPADVCAVAFELLMDTVPAEIVDVVEPPGLDLVLGVLTHQEERDEHPPPGNAAQLVDGAVARRRR
jgi:hypothetical protein